MKKTLLALVVSLSCFGQVPAHPRLWKSQLDYLRTVASKRSGPDYAAYQAMKAEADGLGAVESFTVTAATHGNPTILTIAETFTPQAGWNEPNFAVAGIGTGGDCWHGNGSKYMRGFAGSPW